MTSFFYWIEDLFVNYLFLPYDTLREMSSWWGANSVNWIFMIIGLIAGLFWMKQLKLFNDNGEEDKSITSHSYL